MRPGFTKIKLIYLFSDLILNKKRGGDLGSVPTKWSKEKVIESARKFKTQKEWRDKESTAYAVAKKRGYLRDCQKFLVVQTNKNRYKTTTQNIDLNFS